MQVTTIHTKWPASQSSVYNVLELLSKHSKGQPAACTGHLLFSPNPIPLLLICFGLVSHQEVSLGSADWFQI